MINTTDTARRFEDSREHLLAELSWLELVIQREVARTSLLRHPDDRFDEFSGLYVSEKEISGYLDREIGRDERELVAGNEPLERMREKIANTRQELDDRIRCTMAAGSPLRIVELVRAFRLTSPDVFMILTVMAPDVDVRFQRYFAYLQNDVSRKRPTLQLLNRIWGEGLSDRISVREAFAPDSRVVSEKLLLFERESESLPFPARQPHAPESLIDFLADVDRLDPRLRSFCTLVDLPTEPLDRSYHARHREVATRLFTPDDTSQAPPLTYVWGPRGSGKDLIVNAAAGALQQRVLRLRCGPWLNGPDARDLLDLLRRDARLHRCIAHIADVELLFEQEPPSSASLSVLRQFLQSDRGLVAVLTGTQKFSDVRSGLGIPLLSLEIPAPSIDEREQIWRDKLGVFEPSDKDRWISRLAVSFCFTPGRIDSVVRSAGVAEEKELFRCCREESNQALLSFATKIIPRYSWDDIVLPADTQAQLDEICNCVRHRGTVYGEWGFDNKLSLGKGLNVLFAGVSGTGKTMSAEIIAHELSLDLFKIDLSTIVSKYVGETERNLSKIFHEAETSNAILFFDEADALFGKRSEVKDAHDRYANIEINYLLQKMDDYSGIVILATNLRSNIDAAFSRRLNYVVEFPFPDETYREVIWRKIFPEKTPLADDIDLVFLAKRFKLAGGNIKNIALNSAFLAASNGRRVTMEHLIQATKREFQKMGRLCSKTDFGRYYRFVREEVEV